MEIEKSKPDAALEEQAANKEHVASDKELQKPAPQRTSRVVRVSLLFAVFVLVVGLGAGGYGQYREARRLDAQSHDLTAQVKQLKTSNDKLKSTNTLLSKSLQTIANEKTSTSSKPAATATKTPSSSGNTSAAAPITNFCDSPNSSTSTADGALTVHGVENLTPSYFGNAAANAATEKVQAVFVTMKNLASSSQTFSVSNFDAVTNTGVVVKPRNYAVPGGGNIWSSSVLTPNGSTCAALIFDGGTTYVTLQMTPSYTTDISTLSLPSPAN